MPALHRLTPQASLNPVRLRDASGRWPWDGALAGRTLGWPELADRVAAAGLAQTDQPLKELDRSLAAGDERALEVVEPWLAALTTLLRTVLQPGPQDLAARPEWADGWWEHWAGIRRVVLGGGTVAGRLGALAQARCSAELAGRATVELAADPAALPLVGLAGGTAPAGPLLLLDWGHSGCKVAVRHTTSSAWASQTAPWPGWRAWDIGTWPGPAAVVETTVEAAARALGPPASGEAVDARVAVANYVLDGVLAEDLTFGRVRELGPDTAAVLERALSARLDRPVQVTDVVHDGTAAARAYAGSPHTAVLVMGSAIGVGFPPTTGQRGTTVPRRASTS